MMVFFFFVSLSASTDETIDGSIGADRGGTLTVERDAPTNVSPGEVFGGRIV